MSELEKAGVVLFSLMWLVGAAFCGLMLAAAIRALIDMDKTRSEENPGMGAVLAFLLIAATVGFFLYQGGVYIHGIFN